MMGIQLLLKRPFRFLLKKIKCYLGIEVESEIMIKSLRKNGAHIGNNVSIINSELDYGHAFLIDIGDTVTITGARVLAHDASLKKVLGYSKVGRVIISDNVFIGNGAIVLPNVTIGKNVIVGAGAVISKDVPENSVVAGNPAKVIQSYDCFINKHKVEIEKGNTTWNTYWLDKTEKEKEEMRNSLIDCTGYDI